VAGAFQQQGDGGLDRRVVVHDQYFCQFNVLRAQIANKLKSKLKSSWNQVNGRLQGSPKLRPAATGSRRGRSAGPSKRSVKNIACA
jgi:hypothetical protein